MQRRILIAGFAWAGLLCTGSRSLGAQAKPDDVARRYFAAVAAQQWDTAAALVDPTAQRRFRDGTLSLLAYAAGHLSDLRKMMSGSGSGGMAVSGTSASGSGGLVAIGQEIALNADSLAKYGAWRVPVYSGAPTIQTLAAMSPVELLTRSYPASRLLCFDGDCFSPVDPRQPRDIRAAVDNDSMAHVIYRRVRADSGDLQAAAREEVLHLLRRDGVWRVDLLPGPLPSVFTLIDQKMGIQPPSRNPQRSRR